MNSMCGNPVPKYAPSIETRKISISFKIIWMYSNVYYADVLSMYFFIEIPVWWCRDDLGVYTSIHLGQYSFTIASPGTSESPIGSMGWFSQ